MELKDISKGLYKINSKLENGEIDKIIALFVKWDDKSILPDHRPNFRHDSIVKLANGSIVSILEYAFLSGDGKTKAVVIKGPNDGQIISIEENLKIENVLLYSKLVDYMSHGAIDGHIRQDLIRMIEYLQKYIKVDIYSHVLTANQKVEMELAINTLNKIKDDIDYPR